MLPAWHIDETQPYPSPIHPCTCVWSTHHGQALPGDGGAVGDQHAIPVDFMFCVRAPSLFVPHSGGSQGGRVFCAYAYCIAVRITSGLRRSRQSDVHILVVAPGEHEPLEAAPRRVHAHLGAVPVYVSPAIEVCCNQPELFFSGRGGERSHMVRTYVGSCISGFSALNSGKTTESGMRQPTIHVSPPSACRRRRSYTIGWVYV